MLRFESALYIYTNKENNLDVACDDYVQMNGDFSSAIIFTDEDNIPLKNYDVDDNSGKALLKILC